jgi:hypothetical protein
MVPAAKGNSRKLLTFSSRHVGCKPTGAMALGRFLVAAATSVACLLAGKSAIAVGRLLAPAGTARPVAELRAALALAPRQTSVWWSLVLQGPARRVVLVVPAAPGTAIDPASSHWFDALEQATAPKIALSVAGQLCGGVPGSPVHDTSESSPAGAIGVSELAVLSSLDEVAAFAKGRGLEFAEADREALLPYAPASRFVAFSYDVSERGGATETLRMTWQRPESKPTFELIAGAVKIPITLWTIASARARLPGVREYEPKELAPAWNVAESRSDYPERRQSWLDGAGQTSWLVEAAGDDLLYEWRVLPGSAGAIQPIVNGYLVEDPAGACAARVAEARSDGARVAPSCAKGALGIVESASGQARCVEVPAPTEIDPEALRCGAFDDLAFALADQDADQTWVTRHRGVLFQEPRQSIEIRAADSTPVSPVVFTSALDANGCGSTGGSSGAGGALGAGGASGVSGTGSGNGGWGGMGGVWTPPDRGGSGSTYPDPYDSHPRTVHEHSDVDVGCTASGGDADCGGDTSSSGDDESCSGDSGDSSSEDSEGCGCESSDDESEGDDCGGDSSGDGGDDCSGDSSSDGGDDCSGDSSGGDDCSGDSGGGDCGGETAASNATPSVPAATAAVSLPRPRRFRPRVSALTLVLCAIALVLRRSGRREYEGVLPR